MKTKQLTCWTSSLDTPLVSTDIDNTIIVNIYRVDNVRELDQLVKALTEARAILKKE